MTFCGLGLGFLPLTVSLLYPATFVATYVIAVEYGHTSALFPYISDTGTTSPEMCIFTLGLSIAMIFVGATVWIRYEEVEEFRKLMNKNGKSTKTWNKLGLAFGMVAALGSAVVGAFPELLWPAGHGLGAFMAFGGGSVYLIIQGLITRRMVPLVGSKLMAIFRLILGITCSGFALATVWFMGLSRMVFEGEDKLKWGSDEGGWEYHLISVGAEWIMAALLDVYFLTFIMEFRRLSYIPPKIGSNIDMNNNKC